MKDVNINIQGMDLDYKQAKEVARSVAGMIDKEPTVVAWHDVKRKTMSPVIEGGDPQSRWHDYGQANGGNLEVNINGDFDFIFADSSGFEELGRGPYISVQDKSGRSFLCRMEELKDPKNPDQDACYPIESATSVSHLHEG